MLKAVIFDKDGVLVDTEGIVMQSIENVVKKYSDIPYDRNDGNGLRGSTALVTFELINEKYQIPLNMSQTLQSYHEEYNKLLEKHDDIVFDGVVELLEELRKNNILFGIGTNSRKENTALSLKRIISHFDVVVTPEDVKASKPAPDTFLLVSKKLGVLPENCIVIGDTNNDSLAARSAGMKFVFRDHNLGLEIDPEPDLIIRSLREVSVEKLKSLFNS